MKFSSKILPPYLRKAQRIEEMIPWLYLKGISTGDMAQALAPLVGAQAQGLSASVVTRLIRQWEDDWRQWKQQSLADRTYVYVWADGIYFVSVPQTASSIWAGNPSRWGHRNPGDKRWPKDSNET